MPPVTAHPLAPAMVLCAAVLLLASCASIGPRLPMSRTEETASDEVSFTIRTLGANGEFSRLSSRALARRLRSRLADRPLSILALSGGGANGAFGAGALAGATRDGVHRRFTVVTGVSAGGLLPTASDRGCPTDDVFFERLAALRN